MNSLFQILRPKKKTKQVLKPGDDLFREELEERARKLDPLDDKNLPRFKELFKLSMMDAKIVVLRDLKRDSNEVHEWKAAEITNRAFKPYIAGFP